MTDYWEEENAEESSEEPADAPEPLHRSVQDILKPLIGDDKHVRELMEWAGDYYDARTIRSLNTGLADVQTVLPTMRRIETDRRTAQIVDRYRQRYSIPEIEPNE